MDGLREEVGGERVGADVFEHLAEGGRREEGRGGRGLEKVRVTAWWWAGSWRKLREKPASHWSVWKEESANRGSFSRKLGRSLAAEGDFLFWKRSSIEAIWGFGICSQGIAVELGLRNLRELLMLDGTSYISKFQLLYIQKLVTGSLGQVHYSRGSIGSKERRETARGSSHDMEIERENSSLTGVAIARMFPSQPSNTSNCYTNKIGYKARAHQSCHSLSVPI